MGQIEVDTETYDRVRHALAEAAQSLSSAGGKLGSAVPALSFGPIGAFIPPAFNALGTLIEGASSFVGDRAQRSSDGIATAVTGFQTVDDEARKDFDKLSGEL